MYASYAFKADSRKVNSSVARTHEDVAVAVLPRDKTKKLGNCIFALADCCKG